MKPDVDTSTGGAKCRRRNNNIKPTARRATAEPALLPASYTIAEC